MAAGFLRFARLAAEWWMNKEVANEGTGFSKEDL